MRNKTKSKTPFVGRVQRTPTNKKKKTKTGPTEGWNEEHKKTKDRRGDTWKLDGRGGAHTKSHKKKQKAKPQMRYTRSHKGHGLGGGQK